MNIYDFVGKEFMSHTPKKRDMKIFAMYMSEKGITQNDISKLTEKEAKNLIDDFFERHSKAEIFIPTISKIKSPKFKDAIGLLGTDVIFMRYLIEKHPKLCNLPLLQVDNKYYLDLYNFNSDNKEIRLHITYEDGKMNVVGDLLSFTEFQQSIKFRIKHCIERGYKFLALNIGLVSTEGDHANILLFNLKKKIYELYDPHGRSSEIYNRKYFENCLKKALPDWTYIDTEILCPKTTSKDLLSFQTIENLQSEGLWNREESNYYKKIIKKYGKRGFCMAWTAFYLDLRLTYPQYNPAWIQQKAIEKLEKGDMVKFIVSYIDFISKQYPEYYQQVTE